jgi:hypothetical protein
MSILDAAVRVRPGQIRLAAKRLKGTARRSWFDDIFKSVKDAHRRAKDDPSILRISIDNRARVKLFRRRQCFSPSTEARLFLLVSSDSKRQRPEQKPRHTTTVKIVWLGKLY